jgi:hypothetical protein
MAKTNTVDLIALLAEVEAEAKTKEAADLALEAKWEAEHKAEMKAYNARIRASHAKGMY